MTTAADIAKAFLKRFDLAITRSSRLERLKAHISASREEDIDLLLSAPREHAPDIVKYLRHSHAQNRQDVFVLSQLNFKRNGFFVEFGATNGIDHSNTHLLETEFGWTGILAEPAIRWHRDLRRNRTAAIDTRCVWKESDCTVPFTEVDAAELSTIDHYRDADFHKDRRAHGKQYEVRTVSLQDLLVQYDAPREIDYLSLDTEGSEYEILSSFDFERFSFRIITCEHNFTPIREKIERLLSLRGYARTLEHISQQDDWYVRINS